MTPSVPLNVPFTAESVVRLSVPAESTPIFPFVEKRLVELAVVEKKLVLVALLATSEDECIFVEVALVVVALV